MTAIDELTTLVEPWLFARLDGDAPLRAIIGEQLHNSMALGKQSGVYVLYNFEGSRDITNHAGEVLDTVSTYLVKAVAAANSYDAVAPAAERILELLHRPRETFTVAGGSLTSLRETAVKFPELVDGVAYRHLGWRFRIHAAAG